MEQVNVERLARAIDEHKFDGRFSVGTAGIVESLHNDFGHSYEQIANISNVSTAGVRRWRERNVGDKSRFEALLKYAEDIVSGKTSDKDAALVSPRTAIEPNVNQQQFLSHKVSSVRPLTIAEAKQGLSMMFDIDPNQIEILIKG